MYCLEITMKDFRVELKVCEGCGALYLRETGLSTMKKNSKTESDGVHCRGCAKWLSEFPAPRRRQTAVRTALCVGGAR
jgi:hypothetical protein